MVFIRPVGRAEHRDADSTRRLRYWHRRVRLEHVLEPRNRHRRGILPRAGRKSYHHRHVPADSLDIRKRGRGLQRLTQHLGSIRHRVSSKSRARSEGRIL